MNKMLKISLTPAMVIVSIALTSGVWFYYRVLVPLYEFAWEGWDDNR